MSDFDEIDDGDEGDDNLDTPHEYRTDRYLLVQIHNEIQDLGEQFARVDERTEQLEERVTDTEDITKRNYRRSRTNRIIITTAGTVALAAATAIFSYLAGIIPI